MQLIKCVNSNQLEATLAALAALGSAYLSLVMGCLLPRLMNKLIATATAKVIKVAVSTKPKSRLSTLNSRVSSLEQNGNNNKTLLKNFENVAQICAKCKKICLDGPASHTQIQQEDAQRRAGRERERVREKLS